MKKILFILVLILLLKIFFTTAYANTITQNVQAVWIATVFNLDYPSTKDNIESQKEEYIQKLDRLKELGINTVVVQVRPKADALYKSNINPWSDVLTGTQGKNPGYDPMAFMIKEAHKRGMAFHAWLNPYRVTTSGTDINSLSETHPARLNPDWLIAYNNALYYNPEAEGVKKHIVATVEEIVINYDVDGIDFDDYFYPSHYPLPEGEDKDGAVANSRRQHINDMIKRVGQAIKKADANVTFGVSPIGIWKNKTNDPSGSNTTGNQSYYSVFGDTRAWIKNEWIDYVVPQIYWETGNKAADYETLVKWWANEVKGTKVKLYISQGTYRDVVAKQIDVQLNINKKYPEVEGSFYYSLRSLLSDISGCAGKISEFNKLYTIYDDLIPQGNPYINTGTVGVVRINYNGAEVQFPDAKPYIDKNNRTQVPIRFVAQAMNFDVMWEEAGKRNTVTLTKGNIKIELKIGDKFALVNGVTKSLDTSAELVQDRTYVPIRFLSEITENQVEWDSQNKIVFVTENNLIDKVVIKN